MKIKFRFPNTRRCIVVWYRNNKPNETVINTPANADMLQTEMLKHRVGYGEIRTVKADETSGLKDVSALNINALASQMQRI